jgi:hypothetical protein
VVIALVGSHPASAAIPQGTLIYGKESVTLVNTGQDNLDLSLLVFVRSNARQPARFQAREWGVSAIAPGQCVQLRAKNLNVGVPDTCRRLVRWLVSPKRFNWFWQSVQGADRFRVVMGSTEVTTCSSSAEQCTFSLDKKYRVENLILTYSSDTLWITNGALTPTPLLPMALCRATNGPLCVLPLDWRPADFDATLDPGGCLELNVAKTEPRRPCSVAASLRPKTAFWRQPFYVISPVTAYTTICPAVSRSGQQRCVVPR